MYVSYTVKPTVSYLDWELIELFNLRTIFFIEPQYHLLQYTNIDIPMTVVEQV